jgi:hypothetical protein
LFGRKSPTDSEAQKNPPQNSREYDIAIHEILEALRNLGVKKQMICSIAATAKAGGRVDIAERDFGLCRQEIRTLLQSTPPLSALLLKQSVLTRPPRAQITDLVLCKDAEWTSASGQKAEVSALSDHVCFGPIADIGSDSADQS